MTTYTYSYNSQAWSDPSAWVGGVVPDGADADVVFPTITVVATGQIYGSYVSIASGESYSVRSISTEGTSFSIAGSLAVAGGLAIKPGFEIDMGGGLLSAGSLDNSGIDIQGNGTIQVAGEFVNETEIVGSGLTISAAGFNNIGTLVAASGDLTVNVGSDGFANLPGSTLTGLSGSTLYGGTYEAGYAYNQSPNTLYLNIGGDIAVDAATIILAKGGAIDTFDSSTGEYVSLLSTLQTVAAAGVLSLEGQTYNWGGPLTIAGSLELTELVTFAGPQLTVTAGGTVSGVGTIAAPVDNDGVITAGPNVLPVSFSGTNSLLIQGPVTGSGTLEIDQPALDLSTLSHVAATLELGGASSNNVAFQGSVGTLILDQPNTFTGAITPSGAGDQIVLTGIALSSVTSYSYASYIDSGVLTVHEGGVTINLTFLGNFDRDSFTLSPGPQVLSTSPPSLVITNNGPVITNAGPADADVYLQDTSTTGIDYAYYANGVLHGIDHGSNPIGNYRLVGTGDFNRDGLLDAVVQDQTAGDSAYGSIEVGLLGSQGGALSLKAVGNVPGFSVKGVGDINGDYSPDIVIQNAGGLIAAVSVAGGHTSLSIIGNTPGYTVEGVGQIEGSGEANVIIENEASGAILYARMAGGVFTGFQPVANTPGYVVRGVGDLNGDGYADLVLQATSGTAKAVYIDLHGGTFSGLGYATSDLPAAYHVQGVQDVNRDGFGDVLVQNVNTGETDYAAQNATGFDHWVPILASSHYALV